MERRFDSDGHVYDDNGNYISHADDDYDFWKAEQEDVTNPLSDDYCKYNDE